MTAPTATASDRSARRGYAACFLIGTFAAVAWIGLALRANDGNPTALLRIGSESAQRSFIEGHFDDLIVAPNDYGHDGQQFYVLAATFPDVDAAEGHVDRLSYRARRLLYPALASPAGEGTALIWTLAGINVLAVGAVCVGFGVLARRVGAPVLIGATAALAPAFIDSTTGSLADGLAIAFVVWGLVLWRQHLGGAIALFTLAALTRETTLVAPAACFLVASGRTRWRLLTPFALFGLWALFIGLRYPSPAHRSKGIWSDATGEIGLPFVAWLDIGIVSSPVLLGSLLFGAAGWAAWRLRRVLPELSLWLLGECLLLVIADYGVAARTLNLARLAPLAIPALALAIFMDDRAARAPSGGDDRAAVETPA